MAKQSYVPKIEVPVEVELTNGTRLLGHVFLTRQTRVSDLLNTPEPFFPFLDEGGSIILVNKFEVAYLIPRESGG